MLRGAALANLAMFAFMILVIFIFLISGQGIISVKRQTKETR
jgi:hypothetical protein